MAEAPRLLVVDDIEDNRFTLTRRLNRQGYEDIAEATNGREALDALRAGRFDLVLLDVMMPEMNGYETLERIKTDPSLRDIPVIMISALDDMDSVIKCIKLGAEDYLPKPFNATLLQARVGASLEKKRMRDQEADYRARLVTERKRADKLLYSILPAGAVQELKQTNTVQPRRFEDVAVLFCDIVGFTSYCDKMSPEQVVGELQTLMCDFEDILDRHGLEKIKTIGDEVFATAGLLRAVENPVAASAKCGLEMAAASEATGPGWQLRVGIHCGPVVAGIVGRKQFLYDLWGDTVNVAARITGVAAPGTVVLSSAAWMQGRDYIHARSLGMVELRGRGEMELMTCEAVD
jgi:class 3 adenylate cyclase